MVQACRMMELVALPVTVACNVLQVCLYLLLPCLVYFVAVQFGTTNDLTGPVCMLGIKGIRISAISVYPGKFCSNLPKLTHDIE